MLYFTVDLRWESVIYTAAATKRTRSAVIYTGSGTWCGYTIILRQFWESIKRLQVILRRVQQQGTELAAQRNLYVNYFLKKISYMETGRE